VLQLGGAAQQTSLASPLLYEMAMLKAAKQEAILSRTREILDRTASDIHDGALQDLKLVMDEIELESDLDVDVDAILDKLATLGQEIRDKLHNIRRLAEKMEVTPALRQGDRCTLAIANNASTIKPCHLRSQKSWLWH